MSRCVYIGNFGPLHSTENEVARALRALGHEVEARQEEEWASWLERPDADVVLWTRTKSLSDQVDVEVRDAFLAACERRGIPVVGYHLDRWWGLAREEEIHAGDPFFGVNLLCTADGGHDQQWKDAGIEHAWFPPAVSEFECTRPVVAPPVLDVAFVGSWEHYGHPEWWPQRARMLAHVRGWYGDGFQCFPKPGAPRVVGGQLATIYSGTKVIVGDSCLAPAADGTPIERYWSDRIPETLGRSGILVHPWVEGLQEQGFDSLAPLTYPLGDMDGLHHAVEYALGMTDDERYLLRHAALMLVQRSHTYTVRMRRLWEILGL